LNEGGIIKPGYSPELDDLMEISRDGKSWLVQLEAEERKATGVNTLKVGYNKVFGYYLEAPKSQSEKIPPHYIRKQTLVNAERYITDELKSFESKVLGAEERQASLEYELFCDIRDKALEHKQKLREVAAYIAQIDCLLNLAEIAELNGYCRPEINETGAIHIEDGRHPVVEKMITGERFVPNTLYMDNEKNQILIITGPNMAGKSTVLRQTALTVIMAQMGGFVPAKKTSIGVTDRIFTRVGALDNLSAGQSTFMVEMQETANILNNATHDSLVIMDEIGRGTSTYDGLSIAWAVAEYLHDYKKKGIKTLFATHYHELTALAQYRPRVNNFNIAVREWNDEIIFLRKLVEGGTNRSYGIQVARLAGIPEKVIRRAKKILTGIEKDSPTTKIKPEPGDLSPPGHVQLSLFEKPYNAVLDKIGRLDLKEMTPIEALNFLNEIKQQVKNYN
jgi:DNA mismatch repair protein MutS